MNDYSHGSNILLKGLAPENAIKLAALRYAKSQGNLLNMDEHVFLQMAEVRWTAKGAPDANGGVQILQAEVVWDQ